jgi:hypothetical protein
MMFAIARVVAVRDMRILGGLFTEATKGEVTAITFWCRFVPRLARNPIIVREFWQMQTIYTHRIDYRNTPLHF